MFQPGKAFYDAYQQGRGNHLAGLAMNSQGEQRQSALAQLAGIDAGAAASMKKGLDDQDRAELAEFSNVILNVPDELKPQVYAKGVQRFGSKFRDLGIEPPADYTQAMPLFQQFAGGGGKPKARSSHILADGTIAFMDEFGNLTRTGEKASNTYGFQTDAQGNVYAQDKRGGTVAPAPMGSVQQGMPQVQAGADPMAGGLDRINQGVQVLKSNGVPVEKINEWADNEFAKLQGSVQGGVVEQAPAQARVAVKPDAPKGYTRVMTPQEVASAGLPQGTSAQVNEATGAISVLNKPLPTPTKQANADVIKQAAQLPSLLRRVDRVAQASEKLGIPGADGGPVDQYALKLSESGQELESAVGQLRSMLMPFVRVPGVGSQSDLEARLDGLQYPDASQPPAVRARNIAELQKFIADLSRAYSSTIKGEQGGQAPVQVRNADDYNRLPPGTQYIDPTGKQRVKK
jgi:hypothetical protein